MEGLFDNISRNFDGPAKHNEETYSYFNRSSRIDVSIVREKLNKWFEEYPNEEKKELKKRFQKDFDPAFYELFLFQLFKTLGFEIEIHPQIPSSSNRPDFLIKKGQLEIEIYSEYLQRN